MLFLSFRLSFKGLQEGILSVQGRFVKLKAVRGYRETLLKGSMGLKVYLLDSLAGQVYRL